MHILDFIMYLVFVVLIWKLLGEEYTTEIGSLIGISIIVIYSILYAVIFVIVDYNWIDMFRYINLNLKL